MKHSSDKAVVCIIGVGYVGLPLAQAFAKSLRVIGFDVDTKKVDRLKRQQLKNPTASTGLKPPSAHLTFTANPKEIAKADFAIICVPTPVTPAKEPDLSFVIAAARVVSQNMKKGCVVILESTVYPGVTEEIVKPILEDSGFKCGRDFKIAYSPERINPGDSEHAIAKVTKVVSGMDQETTELVSGLYRKVTPHIFQAKNIKTAEAAKAIENIQRDLNIALMNELSLIFEKMGLDTGDVLDAAATKWNFQRYSPGLVGGHCIPVDPYYLVHKAEELDYHPQVILAGRAINDYMPKHVAQSTIKALNEMGKVIKGSKVLIMGLTYKENVADIRESPVKDIIKELKEYGIKVFGHDPLLENAADSFGIPIIDSLKEAPKVDAVILTVAHNSFKKIKLAALRDVLNAKPALIDVRRIFKRSDAERAGFYYWSL